MSTTPSTGPHAPVPAPATSGRFMRALGRPYVSTLLLELARDIKLSHTLFAMPFALWASFLAWPDEWSGARFGIALGLIIVCMVTARTAAMLANRVLDRHIDKDNPRTATRAIPSGRVRSRDAIMVLIGAAAAFFIACAAFGLLLENWWPLTLSPLVLGWICAYPLLKRYSALCHLYLGSSLALSPVAATIAVQPDLLAGASIWLLAAYVLLWVAGFDVIYALQDVDVDKAQGIFSLPSKLGPQRALKVSRALHGGAFACLLLLLLVERNRMWPWLGIGAGIVALLLVTEHLVVAKGGTKRVQIAFFTLNGVISCVLGGLGIAAVLLSRGR